MQHKQNHHLMIFKPFKYKKTHTHIHAHIKIIQNKISQFAGPFKKMFAYNLRHALIGISQEHLKWVKLRFILVLYDFLVTVKAAPHECVISTGQP